VQASAKAALLKKQKEEKIAAAVREKTERAKAEQHI
jgi:hypothetical protein